MELTELYQYYLQWLLAQEMMLMKNEKIESLSRQRSLPYTQTLAVIIYQWVQESLVVNHELQ